MYFIINLPISCTLVYLQSSPHFYLVVKHFLVCSLHTCGYATLEQAFQALISTVEFQYGILLLVDILQLVSSCIHQYLSSPVCYISLIL